LSDSDAEGNRDNLLHMIALKERLPDLIIVPAHDMRAFAAMPKLSPAVGAASAANRGVSASSESLATPRAFRQT